MGVLSRRLSTRVLGWTQHNILGWLANLDSDLTCLSGQVKSGQWWSGQNRPTDVARDVILLAHFLLVRQVRFRAPAPWPAFQDVTVV